MKNIIYFLSFTLLLSCSDESVDALEPVNQTVDALEDHNKRVDFRATVIINRQDLSQIEIFDLYKELSDIDDKIVKSDSKNLVMFYLVKSNFINNANLTDIEYLIQDQRALWSNVATVNANYQLFNLAIDLNSSLDIPKIEKEFRIKNKDKVYEYFGEEDFERQQFILSSTFFQLKMNLQK
jgi:hypothetical protein